MAKVELKQPIVDEIKACWMARRVRLSLITVV